MTTHTYHPDPAELAYDFGPRKPVLRVQPGDVIQLFTEDCFGGAVRSTADLPSQVCTFPYLNPVTGPFHIEGAEPGDTIAVHLVSITPARDHGFSATFPHFGALTSTGQTATLQPPLEERVWRYDIDTAAGIVRYRARTSDYTVDLPLDPMHGTIGVAPLGEARLSISNGRHDGNIDTPELRAGVTVYLGVNVDGALLALGDGHARQGEGEACGVGVEAAMNTTLAVDLIKGVPTPWPRFESDTHIGSIGCARPLEDAFRIAYHDLVTWTADLTGLDPLDAYQLASQAAQAPTGNVCDTDYSIVAKIPKPYLHGAAAYNGTHDRLRATIDLGAGEGT